MADIQAHKRPDEAAEIRLIRALAGEIVPFRARRPRKEARTLSLTPYGSDLFGFNFIDGEPYLGWPQSLFELFLGTRWHFAARARGLENRLCLVMAAGPRAESVALAIRMRRARLELLTGRDHVLVVPMNGRGAFNPQKDAVSLPLRHLPGPEWEK